MRALHSPQYQIFVSRLVEIRYKAGVTQAELAARINKPQSYVSKVERCERRLDVAEFIAYVRGLDRDPAYLLRQIERSIAESRYNS